MDQLQRCIDKIAILERLSAYTLTLDGKDAEGWVNCFTEDGAFSQGGLVIRGRANLRDYAEVHGKALGSRHITASPVYQIDESGLRATGQSTTVVTVAGPSGYRIAMIGAYDDELEKIDGTWLISRRVAMVEGLASDPGYPMLAADPEMETLVQPLLDAWQRLSE